MVDRVSRPLRVLFVCTANVIRSPAAELLTRAALDRLLGDKVGAVEVISAGTWASTGRGIEPAAVPALESLGVSAAAVRAFAARQLTRDVVGSADLILGASIEHRRAVWLLDLGARHRTFTMHEFAALLTRVPNQIGGELRDTEPAIRGRRLVAAADAVRECHRKSDATYDTSVGEVPDPMGETPELAAATVHEIAEALRPLCRALANHR